MREILFRGKWMDNGEWVEGYYVEAEKLNKSGVEYFIIEKAADGRSREIIPETIGQYTGFDDKNGKKIFEGYIVKHTQKYDISGIAVSIGIVKWSNGYGAWVITGFNNGRADMFLGNEAHRVEVIGNIHDNPDLLEEVQK